MVLYDIQVNTRIVYMCDIVDVLNIGEANARGAYVKYNCLFSKMIESWREIWNNRRNGTTDIQFPFYFVQVSSTKYL